MATLPTLSAGDVDTTNSDHEGQTSATAPLQEIGSANDTSYIFEGSNKSATTTAYLALEDLPADFETMDTLSVQYRLWADQVTNNKTLDSITVQIFQSDRSTALTNAETVSFVGGLSDTTPTNSSVLTMSGVTAGSKTLWDGAVVAISFAVSRSMGGNNDEYRISAFELTGTYTQRTGVNTFGSASLNGSASITAGPPTSYGAAAISGSATIAAAGVTVLPFKMSASANIAASGEATTAQLTAGGGDFAAGRVQDDENPTDAVPFTFSRVGYTELEWAIEATSAATDATTYEFRVVRHTGYPDYTQDPLETYTVTPQWTIQLSATPVTVNATTIACTSTVPAPTVTAVQNTTVSPAVIACTSTAPAPTVTQGTGNSTSPATAACTSTVPAVTVSTGTGVSVSPGVIACTTSVPTSTVKVNETLLIPVIACTSTVPSPTITQGSGVTVSPTTVATAATVPAPTVTQGTGVTVNAGVVATAATTPAPTVQVSESLSVGVIAATSSLPAPTVSTGTGVSVSPATIACTSSVPAPTITVEANITVSPATIAAVSTVPAVTVIASGNIQITPSTIATAATTPAVTVSLGTGVTVSPSTVGATSTVPAVTLSVDDGSSPATIAAVATVPTVTITQGAGVTVSPGTVAATSTVPAPVVLTGVVPDTIEAVTVVLGPTVTVGAGITVGVDVVSCSGTLGPSKVTKPLFVVPGQLPIPRRGGRLQFDVAAGHRQGDGKSIKI